MVYRVIGLMSGSSLDGLDMAYVEFQEQGGKWSYEILETDCLAYSPEWIQRLQHATELSAKEYQLLHSDYGHYIGQEVNRFIREHQLQFKVALVSSHGHTTFHIPEGKMTGQLGNGASIAAETGLPIVTDLRAVDVALGGQGAPIVPVGEKYLLGDFDFFLNLGGIANVSHNSELYVAFDICPANRVLNLIANELGKEYDEGGNLAASGKTDQGLLEKLDQLEYYKLPYPKSLANDFGTDIVYPLVKESGLQPVDALRTYTEHIAKQVAASTKSFPARAGDKKMLVTGGGAFNKFMIGRLTELLKVQQVELVVPDARLISFKEALIMGFIGVLRWRQEYNVLPSVTGASRASINGALWTGEEA